MIIYLVLVVGLTKMCHCYKEPVYVDGDSVLNSQKQTRIEIEEIGRFDEVFSDHVVKHSEQETRAHVSSSTEDISDMFSREQLLITDLLRFLEGLEKEMQRDKSGYNLNKLKKAIKNLEVYLVDDKSSASVGSNPVAAFNIVWRATKLWPQKIKALTAHFKIMKTSLKHQNKMLATFPERALTSFPVTEMAEITAAAQGLLSIQLHSNITCEDLISGFGDERQRLSVDQIMEIGQTAKYNSYLNFAVDWYQKALDHCDVNDKKLRSKLRLLVAEAREAHDRHLLHDGFFQIDPNHKRTIITNEKLYDTELEESVTFQKHK